MKYEKQTNRLLNYFSKETDIPKDKLHLIGITPEQIDKALTQMVDRKIPLLSAQNHLKTLWSKSAPMSDHATPKEMEMMGFTYKDNIYTHKVTGTTYTTNQIKSISFKEIEYNVFNHPLYLLSKI